MPELSIGSVFAEHRIEAVAGRGGMGVVYRATHVALDVQRALKVIAPDLADDEGFRQRFQRESRIAASIRHPHVIPIHHAGEEDGRLFITMDYIDGPDLRGLIARDGRLEPHRVAALLTEVAGALDAAHKRGLVHRDIKPANVLIDRDSGADHAYLTDFGLTKQLGAESGMTRTGMWIGTLDYMAPEQIEGRKTLDARTDVYALGCMLYEALTGDVPYPRDSDVPKMYAHMHEPPPSPLERTPDIPPQFEAIVKRALAKSPHERYPSAGDLGHAVLAAVEGRSVARSERSVAEGEAAPTATVIAQGLGPPPVPTDPQVPVSPPPEPVTPFQSSGPDRSGEPAKGPGPFLPPVTTPEESAPPRADPAVQKSTRFTPPRIAIVAGSLAIVALVVLAVAGVFGGGETEAGSDPPAAAVSSAPPDPQPEIEEVVLDFSHARGTSKCDFVTEQFLTDPTPTSCREFFGRLPALRDVEVSDIDLNGRFAEAVRQWTFRGGRFEQRMFLRQNGTGWLIDGQGRDRER